MKVIRMSALSTGRLYPWVYRREPWNVFLVRSELLSQ